MCKIWRLCHATDFQTLMYPCFTFCRILGMFPYKINSSTFKISKLQYILSSVVICILCICNGIVIHDLISKIHLRGTNRTLENVCYFILNYFIIIVTHVLCGPRMRLLQTILKVSSKLSPKSYEKLSKIIHVKDILSTIIIVALMCNSFPKMKFFYNLSAFPRVFSVYCSLLVLQMNTLYINSVYVLKACFKNINDDLTHMKRLMINDTKSHIYTIDRLQRNHVLLKKLKILKKWHLMVSGTVQLLNVIFSLQILAVVVMVFSNITFEIYFHVVSWKNGIHIIFDKDFIDVIFLIITFHIMLIIPLVWTCETNKNQAQEIRTTIHDLLNNTGDKEIGDELHLFSLQILHCKNLFATKGLTIDATLLAAMTGSITTYTLILIQFFITSHSCDEKSITNITQ